MKVSNKMQNFVAVFMAVVMLHLPLPTLAAGEMISTSAAVEELNRAQAQLKVHEFLTRADVRSELIERGVSPDEVSQRIASLSEAELKMLAGQIENNQAGGDVLVISLGTVLLIIIILLLLGKI